jgi:hypothetical protein
VVLICISFMARDGEHLLCFLAFWNSSSHTKERLCMRGIGKGKETKNLSMAALFTV